MRESQHTEWKESCRDAGTPEPQIGIHGQELLLEFRFPAAYLRIIRGSVTGPSVETSVKTSVKTTDALLELLRRNPQMNLAEAAAELGRSVRAVEMASAKLAKAGKLRHLGPRKGGRWEVLP